MLRMLRCMKSQWKTVIAIIVLLFVQAICDLSLPSYTSDLIDVGIQNSGIEFATPTVIRASEYEKVQTFMTQEEKTKWQSSFEQGEDGNYHVKDDSSRNMQELDDTFTHPILITYMLSRMDDSDKAAMAQQMAAAPAGSMPDYLSMRAGMEEKMESMGDTLMHSTAVAYAKEDGILRS